MEKIIRITRWLDKALSILQVFFIVAMAIVICGSLAGIIGAKSFAEAASQSTNPPTLNVGVLKLWMQPPVLNVEDMRAFLITFAIAIAAILVVSLFAIRLFKRILGDMKEGLTFSPKMPDRIRQIAYLTFAYAVITPVIPSIFSYYMFKLFGVGQILSASPLVEKVETSFSYNVNILGIVTGFAIILLSMVFEYGVKLQRESDETL